ncbi:MAG: 4Fe-4S dicluster domain-containing protein, partial [Magnetospiraceae bacterium]
MHMDLEDLMQNRGGGAPAPMDTFPAGPYIPEALDCQRCGQCLRGCPTYKVNPVENQGPRGRVRLIERVLRKNEPLNADDREALTACTLCRTCETLCPSKMDYGALYQQAMAALAPPPTRDPVVGFLLRLFTRGGVTRAVLPSVIHLY